MGNFIELTERRNLFVHAEGIVSKYYIETCIQHGYSLPKEIKVGDKLWVPQSYFNDSYRCLFEMSVKLGQVVWRKLLPNTESLLEADSNIIKVSYDLISAGKYSLACKLLAFICQEPAVKHANEENRLILTINLAQSYKWSNQEQECSNLLNSHDWSAKDAKFRPCVSVLREEWDSIPGIMTQLGNDDIWRSAYHEWPIFNDLKNRDDFKENFKKIFGSGFDSEQQLRHENFKEAFTSIQMPLL